MTKCSFSIATMITLVRLCLIPVIVFLLFSFQWTVSFYLLIIAIVSDFLDGFFARLLNQESKLGALLDHLADKILIITLFVSFLYLPVDVPRWLLWLILIKEILLLSVVGVLMRKRHVVKVAPLAVGKVTMAIQMFVALWIVASKIWILPLHSLVISALVIFVLLSLIFYGIIGWQLLHKKS